MLKVNASIECVLREKEMNELCFILYAVLLTGHSPSFLMKTWTLSSFLFSSTSTIRHHVSICNYLVVDNPLLLVTGTVTGALQALFAGQLCYYLFSSL